MRIPAHIAPDPARTLVTAVTAPVGAFSSYFIQHWIRLALYISIPSGEFAEVPVVGQGDARATEFAAGNAKSTV